MNTALPLRTATCVGGGAKMNLKLTARDKVCAWYPEQFHETGCLQASNQASSPAQRPQAPKTRCLILSLLSSAVGGQGMTAEETFSPLKERTRGRNGLPSSFRIIGTLATGHTLKVGEEFRSARTLLGLLLPALHRQFPNGRG